MKKKNKLFQIRTTFFKSDFCFPKLYISNGGESDVLLHSEEPRGSTQPDLKIQLECIKTKFVQGNGKNQNRASFTLSELTTWLLGGFKHPHENFGLFFIGNETPFHNPPPNISPLLFPIPFLHFYFYVNTM